MRLHTMGQPGVRKKKDILRKSLHQRMWRWAHLHATKIYDNNLQQQSASAPREC